MVGSVLTAIVRPSLATPSGRRAVAASATFAIASAALLGPLAGCETVRSIASGEAFEPKPEVPARREVGTSSTPVQTASAPRARTEALGNSAPAAAPDAASPGGLANRNSVNAPLAVSGMGAAARPRRSSIALPGVYAPAKSGDDVAPSEGVANLAQVSFASEGGDFSPDIDRGGTFMVYASTQHRPTFDLYRKAVDGRTVTQLTNDPSDDLMPAISPDGTMVAFASNRSGNWDIFTMPITGGAPTQVTFDADEEVQPTWAPDGKRLAFSRQNGRTGAWEIWIVDTSMPGVRSFVCEGFMPRWAPVEASDKLLFQRARQRGSRLYGIWTVDIVQGEGRNPTEVLSARNAAILQPSWSPDGTRIVFTTVNNPEDGVDWPERADIWLINADGTGRVGLTRDQFRNMQPVWSTDGRIYFVSNRSGLENIWSLSVDPPQAAGAKQASAAARPMRSGSASRPAASSDADDAAGYATPDFLKADQVVGGLGD